jgi:hypothetical protein
MKRREAALNRERAVRDETGGRGVIVQGMELKRNIESIVGDATNSQMDEGSNLLQSFVRQRRNPEGVAAAAQ